MKETLWDKIRHTYWRIIPYDWRPGQIVYRLKCFLWKRYSTVKPRSLPHTWCDRCELLPHMMFEILSQFIERECSPGIVEWYGEYGHKITVDGEERYVRDEMQSLYDWWHYTYLKAFPETEEALWAAARPYHPVKEFVDISEEDKDDAEEIGLDREGWVEWAPEWESEEAEELWNLYMEAQQKLERRAEAELTARMHRLVNIKPYLWT